jgi:hypothetical protein
VNQSGADREYEFLMSTNNPMVEHLGLFNDFRSLWNDYVILNARMGFRESIRTHEVQRERLVRIEAMVPDGRFKESVRKAIGRRDRAIQRLS